MGVRYDGIRALADLIHIVKIPNRDDTDRWSAPGGERGRERKGRWQTGLEEAKTGR